MRRKFTPPTSLLLTLLSLLLAPLLGVGQVRVLAMGPFFSDSAGGVAPKASVATWANRTLNQPSVDSAKDLFFLAPSQSTATLQGRIVDQNGAVVPGAKITARHDETRVERIGETDNNGNYQIATLVVGSYRVEVRAGGFRTAVLERLSVEVARIVVQDFRLEVGDINQSINVTPETPLVELATVSFGQVINERTVQEIPLNGRYFIDLSLLIPGSVTPPQNGFLSPPTRGGGSLALNTAGNREDTINFQINGVTLNDQVNNHLNFNPPLASIREFKIDNSTFSAEHGRNSGAIVNVATRSGGQNFHGELYEFFRNNALDARNFFNFCFK